MTGPDRQAVRQAFQRAADTYAAGDFLHAEIRARLLERLDLVRLEPNVVLDIGAGPPAATGDLARRLPNSEVLAIDLVPEMLGAAPQKWTRLCADAARLPLADGSADLLVAGMLLHWCADRDLVFAEARRVLRYPGLFLFTTLGPDTLKELRSAWARVDRFSHTLAFTDMHILGDALVRAGFAEPVVDTETLKITYRDVRHLVADLRSTGTADLGPQRRRTLTGGRRWAEMNASYERLRDAAGVMPATIEVIYGQAWIGEPRVPDSGGEIAVPLERLRRRHI